jgi:ammonia channel protein AmtB
MTTERLNKAKFYLDEAHRYFDIVNEARRKLDEKINNFIALCGVLVNVIVGLAIFYIGEAESKTTLYLLLVSVALYLVVIAIGLISYRPFKFKIRGTKAVIEKFDGEGKSSELFEPIEHLAWNLSHDAEINEETLRKKALAFRVMLVFFAVAILFLAIALVSIF